MGRDTCRWCDRFLPDGRHHLVRYCPDRDCAAKAKRAAKNRRRRAMRSSRRSEPGDTRSIRGVPYVQLPDHPLAPPSGWLAARRAAVYDAFDGDDPSCSCCRRRLDWSAPAGSPSAVKVVEPKCEPVSPVAVCGPCLVGVGLAGRALGTYVHPLAWGEAGGDVRPPQGEDAGGAERTPSAAAPGGPEGEQLPAAVDALEAVWDGTEAHAQFLAAAATVLGLRARMRGAR